MHKVALIGCGRQNTEDHLDAINNSKKVTLDCVCDIKLEAAKTIGEQNSVRYYSSLETLLKERTIDFAVVALPHNEYLNAVKILAKFNVNILKEKPFATSLAEALTIKNIVESSNIKMMITLQRRFNPIYQAFLQLKDSIGEIYNIDAQYTLNINRLDEGWRSNYKTAGGVLCSTWAITLLIC
jgi:predicted dehydrogenase